MRGNERKKCVMRFLSNDQFPVLTNDGFNPVLASKRFLHISSIHSSKTFCGNDCLLPCPTTIVHVPYCKRKWRKAQMTRKEFLSISLPMVEISLPNLFAISLFETPADFQIAILSLSPAVILVCLIFLHPLPEAKYFTLRGCDWI